MNFLGNMAKEALSSKTNSSSNNDNTSNNDNANQSTDSGNSWSDVGRAAKSAYESQSGGDNAGNKPVDYAQVGGVAKKAAAAYNAGGGKLDAQTVGKEFVSGFMGKGQQQQQQGSSVCFGGLTMV